ncbi:MAG: hypothetical protein WA843_01275 [Candidatus Saccharimonadales bacterium]
MRHVFRRPKTIRVLLTLAVLSCLIVGVAIVLRGLATPSRGVIQAAAPAPASTATTSLQTLRGKTASFQYPSVLEQRKADALSGRDVEKFALVRPQLPAWDLAIQIRQLPSGVLADDGSYNFRKHYPDKYHETKMVINGQAVPIMADQSGGFAEVAYLTRQGLVAEISLSSDGTSDTTQLDQTLTTVLQTWHWM